MVRIASTIMALLVLTSCANALTTRYQGSDAKTCVQRKDVRWSNVRDTQTIDFKLRDGSMRRNRLDAACGNLVIAGSFEPVGTYAEYCPGDEIMVPNPSNDTGEFDGTVCKLGSFMAGNSEFQ